MMQTVLAGNAVDVETVVNTETPPTPDPTATVYVADMAGNAVATLTDTVNVAGTVVTVTASWQVPDTQAGGIYYIITDIGGTVVAADQEAIRVIRRVAPVPA